ncbi:hypothetical protein A6R68_16340 [Neotoma lepida]|uniref:Uncharacterized protein n=1 Tax=Neotoma lepida TaxID=56216 RepID=A0A1A6HG06_NEOLE|nr:hypothetical protein A6R68_16340 [Neotoma lepida]
MQLLAGVKLCTGRTLTNHPHYEDKSLRERTQAVYQIYAKRSPEEVHSLLRSFGADFVILEDSICYERRHQRGCRLRDLLDVANGHVSMLLLRLGELSERVEIQGEFQVMYITLYHMGE